MTGDSEGMTEPLTPPPVIEIPSLSATDRLVELPPVLLANASDGSQPRLKTAVRVGYRNGALEVRFDGRDREVVATKSRRDDSLWEEDVFEVFLSPHEPPVVYYEFEVNPLGTVFDARIESPKLVRPMICVDVAWDCAGFRARVRRKPESWSARLTISLAPLALGEIPATWRANFFRVDRGRPDELSAWSPVGSPVDFHRADRFGTLWLPRSGS